MLVARRVAERPSRVATERKFAVLRRASRVWAVAAIHGDVARLAALHQELGSRFEPGDRLVYLGNYLGHGPHIIKTVEELLRFRREIIGRPLMFTSDIAYLRGSQEEMWQKLLQLHFAVNPREILDWVLAQGAAATLRAYGGDAERGQAAMRDGAVAIGRWTESLRQGMATHPGHRELMSTLCRAAHTDDNGLLFVNAGIDPVQPLEAQGDALWWGHAGWRKMTEPYQGYRRVVRGFDRSKASIAIDGVEAGPYTLTVDGGCGRGGKLIAVCLSPEGDIVDRLDA